MTRPVALPIPLRRRGRPSQQLAAGSCNPTVATTPVRGGFRRWTGLRGAGVGKATRRRIKRFENRKMRRISLKTLESELEVAGPASVTRAIGMRILAWRPGLAAPQLGLEPFPIKIEARRHCERSEAIQGCRRRPTITGLLRRFASRNDNSAWSKTALALDEAELDQALGGRDERVLARARRPAEQPLRLLGGRVLSTCRARGQLWRTERIGERSQPHEPVGQLPRRGAPAPPRPGAPSGSARSPAG